VHDVEPDCRFLGRQALQRLFAIAIGDEHDDEHPVADDARVLDRDQRRLERDGTGDHVVDRRLDRRHESCLVLDPGGVEGRRDCRQMRGPPHR
jgi:hypothetical protein